MKIKFAGLLRGFWRQPDDGGSSPAAAAPLAPAPASVAAHFPAPPRTAGAHEIELPLAPVIAALPLDLRAKLMHEPVAGMTICLPVETAMSQLAFGAVKISFGDLRRLAPGIFANSGSEHDKRPVSLPLQEILARLNPALLARQAGQKIEVSEEVAGPFGGRGQGIAFTTQPLKPAPVARPLASPPGPPPAAHPRTAQPVTPPVALRTAAPAPEPMIFTRRTVTPAPSNPFPRANQPGNTNGSRMVPPPSAAKTFAAPAPVPAAALPRPEPAQPTIYTALGTLCENWPEELKDEIIRMALADATVPLAGATIAAGLKRGRVTLTWKELRTLARAGSPASPNDQLELELPLKVIAPLYLAAQKKMPKAPTKVSVNEDIPDLFFGFPQAAPAPEPPPVRAAALPVHAPPVAAERKPADTNFYVWGDDGEAPKATASEFERPAVPNTDFAHRQSHPREVVSRAVALSGVAGAVVALPDGLCVASQVPVGLNADALAAFLPQIFERVNQTTRELRMGALKHVSFTVGNVPWKIFRVSSVYFAALGRAGEGLPSEVLALLAGELDRKNQQ